MTIYKQTFFATVFTFLLLVAFSPKLQAQEYKWGAWTQDPCYRGLQFRSRYSDYNESAKKHHWYVQYKNNYQQRFAFTYELAGTREELAAKIKGGGSGYRTMIKPAEIDSGMWVLTSNPSQIFEVSGQGRLLGANEPDIEGTFMQCDIGGLIGKVDYICNNMPKTAYSCSNYVHPKPAAVIFPKSGYTVASTEDCLEIYEYFSKYRKSDDPVAVKQAIESANALRARCKLTPDQQTAVDQAITSTQNRLERIQSNSFTSQSQSPGADLITGSEAVKKVDLEKLKQQLAEYLQSNVVTRQGYQNSVSLEQGKLKLVRQPFEDVYTYFFDFATLEIRDDIGGWYPVIRFRDGTGNEAEFMLRDGGDSLRGPVTLKGNQLLADIRAAQSGVNTKKISDKETGEDEPNLPKIEPTTVEEYQKQVVVEAKAKGITLSPNYLTNDSTTPKKTPTARLTPTQKAAQNAINSQQLSDLIVQDIQSIAEELKANAEIERKQAEEKKRKEDEQKRAIERIAEEKMRAEQERIRAEQERIQEEAREQRERLQEEEEEARKEAARKKAARQKQMINDAGRILRMIITKKPQ